MGLWNDIKSGLKKFGNMLNDGITSAADWVGDKWNRITGKSSAHQIEVEDMENAGLNPMLSAGGSSVGSSAGNPVSSAASLNSSVLSGISDIIHSAASLTNNRNIDRETTQQIYDASGRLIGTAEKLVKHLK